MLGWVLRAMFRHTLATALADKSLTQAEFVDRIEGLKPGSKFNTSEISRYVTGKYCPRMDRARIMCEVLGLDFKRVWDEILLERGMNARMKRVAGFFSKDVELEEIINQDSTQLSQSERSESTNIRFIKLSPRNTEEIEFVLNFDRGIYPTSKPVTQSIMRNWLSEEDSFSFTLRSGKILRGYCVAFPLSASVFNQLLQGEIQESELPPSEINSRFKNLYIYSNMADSHLCAGMMLLKELLLFSEYGMEKIGGLVVSPEEDRLCQRLKLRKIWTDAEFPSAYKPTTYLGDPLENELLQYILMSYPRYFKLPTI